MRKAVSLITTLVLLAANHVSAEQLTLADALGRGSTGNQTLRITRFEEQIAGETIRAARGGLYPRIDFQAGYTAQLDPQSINTPAGSFSTQQADYGFFSLGIYQTLFDFGRTEARIARAKASREAAASRYKGQQQDLFLRIITAYFRILQEQSMQKSADLEVEQMEDHLRIARNLFEQGVVTRNDLLQAEVRLASSRQRRLDVRNRIENSWLWLNYLMGNPPDFKATLVADTRFDRVEENVESAALMERRPEFQAQKKLLEMAELDVTESRSSLMPEFFARAGMDYVQNDKVKEQAIFAATLGFKANLFEGGAGTSRREAAIKSRAQVSEQLRELQLEIELEYRTAVNDANVASERISLTEASIRQGEENLRINRDRYTEHVGTATDVLDAQTLLTQIRTENAQAVFDYEIALAKVKRARGDL